MDVFASETSYLVPNTTLMVLAVIYLAIFVVWPFVEAAARGRAVWAVAIVLLSPIAGILWFAIGKRTHSAPGSRVRGNDPR